MLSIATLRSASPVFERLRFMRVHAFRLAFVVGLSVGLRFVWDITLNVPPRYYFFLFAYVRPR